MDGTARVAPPKNRGNYQASGRLAVERWQAPGKALSVGALRRPPGNREAVVTLEPLALVYHVHLLELGLGLRQVEYALDDADNPHDTARQAEREQAT